MVQTQELMFIYDLVPLQSLPLQEILEADFVNFCYRQDVDHINKKIYNVPERIWALRT